MQSWLQVNSVQTTNSVAPEQVQQQTAANVMLPSEPSRNGYVKCSTNSALFKEYNCVGASFCVWDETMQVHLQWHNRTGIKQKCHPWGRVLGIANKFALPENSLGFQYVIFELDCSRWSKISTNIDVTVKNMAASLKIAEVSFNRSTTIESFSLGDQLRGVFILHSLARASISYTPNTIITSIPNFIHYYYEWNALACLSKTKKVDITAQLSTHY